jgi:hypothetical protein
MEVRQRDVGGLNVSDRLTFLGHSTVRVDLDGVSVLTDPMLGHMGAGAIRRQVEHGTRRTRFSASRRSSSATVTGTTSILRR